MLRPLARIYAPLADHLAAHAAAGAACVTLPFAAIEALLGRPLPATARAARRHVPWWRGDAGAPHAWYGWQRVGWRVETVDRAAETVTFARPGA